MKTKLLIITVIVLASVVIGSAYAVSVQIRCEDLLGDTHYPRPLTLWNCLDYLNMVDNPPPKSIPEPESDDIIQENSEIYTWHEITGLKDNYVLGESISFTEIVQGYGNPCVYPHYEILNGNTLESVWKYKIVYPCPFIKNPEPFNIVRTVTDKDTHSPVMNQTGSYIFRSYHSYSDEYTEIKFSVE